MLHARDLQFDLEVTASQGVFFLGQSFRKVGVFFLQGRYQFLELGDRAPMRVKARLQIVLKVVSEF